MILQQLSNVIIGSMACFYCQATSQFFKNQPYYGAKVDLAHENFIVRGAIFSSDSPESAFLALVGAHRAFLVNSYNYSSLRYSGNALTPSKKHLAIRLGEEMISNEGERLGHLVGFQEDEKEELLLLLTIQNGGEKIYRTNQQCRLKYKGFLRGMMTAKGEVVAISPSKNLLYLRNRQDEFMVACCDDVWIKQPEDNFIFYEYNIIEILKAIKNIANKEIENTKWKPILSLSLSKKINVPFVSNNGWFNIFKKEKLEKIKELMHTCYNSFNLNQKINKLLKLLFIQKYKTPSLSLINIFPQEYENMWKRDLLIHYMDDYNSFKAFPSKTIQQLNQILFHFYLDRKKVEDLKKRCVWIQGSKYEQVEFALLPDNEDHLYLKGICTESDDSRRISKEGKFSFRLIKINLFANKVSSHILNLYQFYRSIGTKCSPLGLHNTNRQRYLNRHCFLICLNKWKDAYCERSSSPLFDEWRKKKNFSKNFKKYNQS